MRTFLTIIVLTAAFSGALDATGNEILNIGDPAPPLTVSAWVKGDKIEKLEQDKTYVVEFWATWCGPCRKSIPHLTELAHRYKDKGVRFIGVVAWERNTARVKPFVEEMGEQMDYPVALDSVPEKGSPDDGAMVTKWMKAAEENQIPTAFVVKEGKIAWIGHPMELDQPLAKITAGDWNAATFAKHRLAAKIEKRRVNELREKPVKLYEAGDYKGALSAIEELTSGNAKFSQAFATLKFEALIMTGAIDDALVVGAKLLEVNYDKPRALRSVFFGGNRRRLKAAPDPRLSQLALRAARRADELTKGMDVNTVYFLADALFRAGDVPGAVATQEKAIKLLETAQSGRSNPAEKKLPLPKDTYTKVRKIFDAQLALFREGAKKPAGHP